MHYAGVGCEMDAILAIAAPARRAGRRGQRARPVRHVRAGRSGRSARSPRRASTRPRTSPAAKAARCSSTTHQFVERAEIIREKGTNRSRFFRGQVDKYTWVDLGSSYLPSDMLAAFLYRPARSQNEGASQASSGVGALQ